MLSLDLKPLLDRLSPYTKRALEMAAGLAVGRGNYDVTVEHFLLAMVDDTDRDLGLALRHYAVETASLKRQLQRAVEEMKVGNPGRPVFAPVLIEILTDAWLLASVELGQSATRSGAVLLAVLANGNRFGLTEWWETLRQVSSARFKAEFHGLLATSVESDAAAVSSGPAGGRPAGHGQRNPDSVLARFATDFTAQARAGKIDPVFCRDREIQQMIDILGRRRKNNPICVGEPGVGKTAVVEGLALKIAQGDVPEFLRQVELVGIDLGMLQAGAGMKGEFENRLKGIIEEVKASPTPIILFVDEAHMMVGAGGAAGGGDAANLLKPALARGELRTIAATTWSEYKKYFEKDSALERRFQVVKLDEPSPAEATTILRGLRPIYERSHNVYVRDDAVVAASQLAARYISGRQLPDKAVDVLDTACARVKLGLSNRPHALDSRERRIAMLERELSALTRDQDTLGGGDRPRAREIAEEVAQLRTEIAAVEERWGREKGLVDRILALRQQINALADPETATDAPTAHVVAEAAPMPADNLAAEGSTAAVVRAELARVVAELAAIQGRNGLLHYEVTPDAVGQVISDWTGIPTGNMVRDEARSILALAGDLERRIRGQDQAIAAIDEGMRAAKAGLNSPTQPMGVFLFVGPSGVGKTELATAVADLLFGGERFLISINMSEFQEKHTVSKLVGSPPGYVGFGEGGILTEAVRQRPYSVVLLDEVEKADPEVMNLFYQVFDKGVLSDGEGRVVDFRNTIVILTSNLATDTLTRMGQMTPRPGTDALVEAIRPQLSRHFKPALLARMQIVPFYPLLGDILGEIVRLKLDKVGRRLRDSQKMAFVYSDAVVEQIVARCTDVETGARNIDHIVNKTLLPDIATEILQGMGMGMGTGREPQASAIHVDTNAEGRFLYRREDAAARTGAPGVGLDA
ncbi:type VI secretion system ATPase TssH [Ancylobacter amanitiformis]|uniref:Type VI secretion system protein VasG n=1 Tax=Ancylobacter amanitiformis TaxID=217069 RepID=A0ABU0LL87_9HYPH|nr:type VI secretion system ATPase TssH [Ancylobacter amanitiformis]MDQ0509461.1 type VI secretion system protein VasG [Ancylobacter amanitiformis]